MQRSLPLRMLMRDWRSGELRILVLALIVAVASTTSVSFFADRVRLALEQQANEMLGGDLAVISDHALAEATLAKAGKVARVVTVEFPSMVSAGDRVQLAALKAAGDGYPLRGHLRVTDTIFGEDRPSGGIPAADSVWLEQRLAVLLGVAPGDSVRVGDVNLRVAAILTAEPARGGGTMFSVAPRLLMNMADLERTGLVQATSRVQYRYLFAGEAARMQRLRHDLKGALQAGERLETVEDAQPELRSALDRSRRFLGLSALICVLLAGTAIAMSVRRFLQRHLDTCALMRCFGATEREIFALFVLQLLCLGVLGGLCGGGAGFLAQYALATLLTGIFSVQLPPPSVLPLAYGLSTALLVLIGFSLPVLLQIRDIPALRVLRRELGRLRPGSVRAYALSVGLFALLVLWQTRDTTLGLYLLGGVASAGAVLGVLVVGVLSVLARLRRRFPFVVRFAAQSLERSMLATVIQAQALGLGVVVLLLLTLVRGDLLQSWEQSLPAETPNRFLINIQADQVDAVGAFLRRHLIREPRLYPMVRGRLMAINEQAVSPDLYQDQRARRLAAREFNLSWAAQLQDDNRIVAGRWWSATEFGAPLLSVEEGVAETLGLALGDRVEFLITGRPYTAIVDNLRSVEWDSFRANFFVLLPPGSLEGFPVSYITSLYLPPAQGLMLNELVAAFPNVTVIDVAAVMAQVRLMIERVSATVEFVFGFALLAGLLVILAAIHAGFDARIRESLILRALGMERRRIQYGVVWEFGLIGAIAGLVAAVVALLMAILLADQVFDVPYQFNGWWVPVTMVLSALVVALAGVGGTRRVLETPPVAVLRGGD